MTSGISKFFFAGWKIENSFNYCVLVSRSYFCQHRRIFLIGYPLPMYLPQNDLAVVPVTEKITSP